MSRNAALLEWYGHERRELPWRRTSDPWHILVSEVMLQQTQASRVIEPYLRFIERFPDPASAVGASAGELLEIWIGLGYNARALRLREAAVRIEVDGWPTTAERLRSLPGVGPYTAAAVACFAFGEQVPAIDTNARRVLSRWVGRPLEPADLIAVASDALPFGDAGDWNQAVMDLGASICRPRPDCAACPVARWCASPDVYVPPKRQSRFEGSVRQARGSILRLLVERDQIDREALTGRIPHDRADEALTSLVEEGTVNEIHGRISLAD